MRGILTVLAASLAATALAVSASAAEPYIPFATDFPGPSHSERYVPFVTDFPNDAPEVPPTAVAAHVRDGVDWLDAAFGAVGGFALCALTGASLLALRRHTSFSTA